MGLYDDDNQAVTGGDLQDVMYWQTKFAHLKLEAALKTRQPESAVAGLIPSVIYGADDVLKTYPNHADVSAWRERAKAIQGKIDPNAPPADFRGDFAHWKDYSYEAGWRSYHIARMAVDAQDWPIAREHSREALIQFGRSLDRMVNWPEEVQCFIREAHSESERLQAVADDHR